MSRTFFTAALLLSNLLLRAQDSAIAMQEVIVTANRMPQKQVNTGKVVTVITRTQIQRSAVQSLGELLGRQSGITIIGAYNAPGANNDIYVRGAATGNVLMLVDGFPAYDVSTIRNSFDINFIPLDEIERVEIVRGGQSTLYGSDAVAGVINIITRKENPSRFQGRMHVSGGSFGMRNVEAGISGSSESVRQRNSESVNQRHSESGKQRFSLNYAVQAGMQETDGFSAALDTSAIKTFDKDGFRRRYLKGELGGRIGQQWQWKSGVQWSGYKGDLDQTAYEDARDFVVSNENLQAHAGLTRKLNNGSLHLQAGLNNNKRNYLDDSLHLNGFARFIRSDYSGNSSFAELYANYRLMEGLTLFAGLDQRWFNTNQYYLSVSSFGNFETALNLDTAKASVSSATASIVWNGARGLNLEAGLRLNQHSRYGRNLTYTFNPSWKIKRLKISYNLSSAFKAPTLYQLFDGFSGERNLKPETSVSQELSLELPGISGWQARATVFYRNTRNGIDYDYANYRYFNYNAQVNQGIELEAGYQQKQLDVSFNYTYTRGRVTATQYGYDANSYSYFAKGDTTYDNLFRIPMHALNIRANLQLSPRLQLGWMQRFAGKRFEPIFESKPVMLASYSLTDLSLHYTLKKRITTYVQFNNIFNTQYQEVRGYATRGRNLVLGVRVGIVE